jgi:hypothetical protein
MTPKHLNAALIVTIAGLWIGLAFGMARSILLAIVSYIAQEEN